MDGKDQRWCRFETILSLCTALAGVVCLSSITSDVGVREHLGSCSCGKELMVLEVMDCG